MKIGTLERSKLAKNGQEFRDLVASDTDTTVALVSEEQEPSSPGTLKMTAGATGEREA